ncbi:MAG: hypothetical protein AAGA80_12470, partial [Cyanobacteria bacterium P01_F01_bin.143]
ELDCAVNSNLECEIDPQKEPEVVSKTESEITQSDSETKSEVTSQSESEIVLELDCAVNSNLECEVDSQKEPEVISKIESEVSQADSEVISEPKPEVTSQPETEVVPDTEPEVVSEPEDIALVPEGAEVTFELIPIKDWRIPRLALLLIIALSYYLLRKLQTNAISEIKLEIQPGLEPQITKVNNFSTMNFDISLEVVEHSVTNRLRSNNNFVNQSQVKIKSH